MIGFFMKKNFFDGWDNMLNIIVPNLVITGVLCIFTFSSHHFAESNYTLSVIILALSIIPLCICTFAFASSALKISNFEGVGVKKYFMSFAPVIKDAILFATVLAVLFILFNVVIPFYVSWSNTVGLLLAALILWIVILSVLALQWFLPLMIIQKQGFFRTLKNCYGYFFDNPFYSLFLFLYNIALSLLSLPLFLIIPSFSGIVLSQVNAVRLRLKKYDYIASHPELTKRERRSLPWKEILKEDREAVGNRSIKSLIFPGRG